MKCLICSYKFLFAVEEDILRYGAIFSYKRQVFENGTQTINSSVQLLREFL
jgi:hypothetical protein